MAAPASSGNGRKGKGKKNNNRQAGNTPMFMVPITDTDPIYIYCSQAQHCQQGMVMVINPPATGATVAQYQRKAAQANNNVSPRGGISGGSVQNNAAGTNPPNGVVGANAPAGPAAGKTGGGRGKGRNGNGNGNGNGKGRNN